MINGRGQEIRTEFPKILDFHFSTVSYICIPGVAYDGSFSIQHILQIRIHSVPPLLLIDIKHA